MKMMAEAGTGLAVTGIVKAEDPQEARSSATSPAAVPRRRIPSTGELLPVIGLGTSRTFDADPAGNIDALVDVMRAFLAAGGTLVDSSPMYRRAEAIVGTLLNRLDRHDLFFATKVWTKEGREAGITQMNESITKMAAPVMDLMQVHNLVAWETHLPTLREWKAARQIRYLGVTEMRNYELTEKLMREKDLDFIQIPYSIGDRRVEGAHPARGTRHRYGRARDAPVRGRPSVQARGWQGPAGVGGGVRLHKLGAVLSQVRARSRGGNMPDTGDEQTASPRGQHAGGRGPAAG